MTQGLIGGVLWGVLAAGFGLMVVSQVATPPVKPQTGAAAPALVAPAPDVAAASQAVPEVAAPQAPPVLAVVPATPVPPPTAPVPDVAVAEPAPEPVAPDTTIAPDLPELADAAPDAAVPAWPSILRKPEPLPPTPAPVPDVAVAEPALEPVAPDTTIAPDLPELADAAPDAAVPARPSILRRPEPLPPTPALNLQGQGVVADKVPATVAVPNEAAAAASVTATAPAAVVAVVEPPAVPPRVAVSAPGAVLAPPPPVRQPALPDVAEPPVALSPPAAVAAAGPPPAAPSPSVQRSAATVVVTEAPRDVVAPLVSGDPGGILAPAATARAGFQPERISPALSPVAPEAAPLPGLLPPPPPFTPEELAILADADAVVTDPALPEIIVLTEADEPAATSILKKPAPLPVTPSLTAKGVVPASESLPRTAPAPVPDPAAGPVPDPAADLPSDPVVTLPDDAPPIQRFARSFDNAAGKPLFAVVLIDTGEPDIDRATLAAIPFAVTFALDPSAPGSATAAAIYRAAGQEVVMLATGIPEGATAADIEVSFGAHDAVLPEAVAVLDLEAGGFQGDRSLSTLVVPVVAGQGRGVLSWDRGLNAASQVARREGVPSGVIFRRLDGEGEPVAQIRRYLDRAAFKAAQDGRVIVAGETRPNTVAAILEWAVEGRASTVALAPLTAALRVE